MKGTAQIGAFRIGGAAAADEAASRKRRDLIVGGIMAQYGPGQCLCKMKDRMEESEEM